MKINALVMEMLRGTWAIQPEALNLYGPIAYNLLYGKQDSGLMNSLDKPKSCMTFFDKNMRPLVADEEGVVEIPKDCIAVVEMVGVIRKYGDLCSYGAEDIVLALEYADNHPNIIGTVLKVDGPGGSTSAVGPFVEFGKRKKKPIVGLYDQACSAHLWALLAVCDYRMADNNISSAIGSIGVVLHWVDNRKYLESIGYEFHEVYPDESEHKNLAARLAMEGKYEMIKTEMLSPMARQFQNYVLQRIPNLDVSIPGAITGKTFSADEAISMNFIHSIGSLSDAKDMVIMLSERKSINNKY